MRRMCSGRRGHSPIYGSLAEKRMGPVGERRFREQGLVMTVSRSGALPVVAGRFWPRPWGPEADGHSRGPCGPRIGATGARTFRRAHDRRGWMVENLGVSACCTLFAEAGCATISAQSGKVSTRPAEARAMAGMHAGPRRAGCARLRCQPSITRCPFWP